MKWPCNYIAGTCDHRECDPFAAQWDQEAPTEADYCAADGHVYYGDDSGVGRCYCGARTYPVGGEP